MSDQAKKLTELVNFFKLGQRSAPMPAARAATPSVQHMAPYRPKADTTPALATPASDDGWDEF